MDNKTVNYILIVLIILVIVFFFKGAIMNVLNKFKALVMSFMPNMNFIYI